jgi:hypothetical protein
MMHLCRLTDSPKSVGHETLTLMRLEAVVQDPSPKATIKVKAEQIKTECSFAREWRGKRLAHTDLAAFRAGHASLPSVTMKQVDDALNLIRDLMRSIEELYGFATFSLRVAHCQLSRGGRNCDSSASPYHARTAGMT